MTSSQIFRECFGRLPVSIEYSKEQQSLKVDCSALSQLHWKGSPLSYAKLLAPVLEGFPFAKLNGNQLEIRGPILGTAALQLHQKLSALTDLIYKDNLTNEAIWGRFQGATPTGFVDADAKHSGALLQEVFDDGFIVKEKKPFVIDLERSHGAYMVSVEPENNIVIDAAAQIASLALGFNHRLRKTMLLRPEVMEGPSDLKKWDVYLAFERLLQEESGLPYVHFVNSGAEANECSFKACQMQYPDRRKVLAFDGSFHGRTLLALHTTHSPAKREPFEAFKGIVSFLPYPDMADPSLETPEPAHWIEVWSRASSVHFHQEVASLLQHPDPLVRRETECLLKVHDEILKELPLAVIIEPIQCEGGDRFASARFYRALRLLTREMDVPLIFDEVQSGLGLGDSFLWHKSFQLVRADGSPDTADCVSLAKKSQVGACLTRFKMELPLEISPASLYRGYIQAIAMRHFDPSDLNKQVKFYLNHLQKTLDPELVANPRCKGLAFAFDLPSEAILNELVNVRFVQGTLFYPAGKNTARFRLMASTTEHELAQIFLAIYKCFIAVAESKKIFSVPPLSDFVKGFPKEFRDITNEKPGVRTQLKWGKPWIPNNRQEYMNVPQETWDRIFSSFVEEVPQVLRSPMNADFPIHKFKDWSKEKLWKRYEEDSQFTLFDLLWNSSRIFGTPVEIWDAATLAQKLDQAQTIQKESFEPERQSDTSKYLEIMKRDSQSIFIASPLTEKRIGGMTFAAPIKNFAHVPLIGTDPSINNPKAMYSADMAVVPEYQGRGLGLRLKVEQYIEAMRQGVEAIRSRNRYPEAVAMLKLNHRMGGVEVAKVDKAYNGKGTALHISMSLNPKLHSTSAVFDPFYPALKNKGTLGNFVSESFIRNLMVVKSVLPERVRHFYIASGRSEALDKLIKLLIAKRPGARIAVSLAGDYFGATTACARSLGDQAGPGYFDWPVLNLSQTKAKSPDDQATYIAEEIQKLNPAQVLGFFIEPMGERTLTKKSPEFLKALSRRLKEIKVPLLFQETGSAFYQYRPESFFAASEDIEADGLYMYAGNQLGFTAVNDSLYLDKPLTMISTWEGDEHSLNLFRNKILRYAKT